jgi:hypothetical protein
MGKKVYKDKNFVSENLIIDIKIYLHISISIKISQILTDIWSVWNNLRFYVGL